MPAWHLAQLNIAQMSAPLESPSMAEFAANLDRVNLLAEQSPGYVWRLQTDDGDATSLRPFGEEVLVNLSVWQDVASLREFVYRSSHTDIMRRRREWFVPMQQEHLVMWWIAAGHEPTVTEADERLQALRRDGPTAYAFNFRQTFEPPQAVARQG